MRRIKNKKRFLCICVISAILLFVVCDFRLKTVYYEIESEKVERPVRFAVLTDLHSCYYGKNQKTLIKAVENQNPDIVLLAGDIFDDKGSYDNAESTIKQLAEKYPCYYVTGNHEYWGYDVDTILRIVDSCGVSRLSGDCVTIEVKEQVINICGVDDPDVVKYVTGGIETERQLTAAKSDAIKAGADHYTVLLSHRPELYEEYKECDFDLIVSGHAHGGQWRIPYLLNGLYAPHQGLFPKYAGGRYDYESGTMIVSRGLARESTPVPRIFNRPELVVIDVK